MPETLSILTASEPTARERKTYYSPHACLVININNGTRIMEGGQSKVVGQKVAEFMPMADGYGRLVTDDPEIIAKLDPRCGPESDVFDGAEYQKRTTPVEVRNKMLETENQRLLTDYNRLLAKLQAEGRVTEPSTEPVKPAAAPAKGAPPSK